MSVALLAAFAVGAVPAVFAPQAGAQTLDCTNATAGNPPGCIGAGKAEISDGDYSGVSGTYPSNGDASGGSVKISGDVVMTGMVYGGRSNQGNAIGNSVTISDRAKAQRVNAVLVYGGYSGSGNTTGNTVQMTGGSMGYMVIGGESAGSGNATGNTVKISGGTVQGYVYGGRSDQGHAGGDRPGDGNSVTISDDAVITRSVYGGQSSQGNATGNTVTISGGTVQGEVYGGDSNLGNAGGTASGEGNRVTISGDAVITRYVYGGNSNKGNATGNSVTIEGNAEIQSKVHGGESSTGLATGNSVTIEGNAKIQGEVYGGYSANNQATGNSVTLNGGTFTGTSVGIYGARAGYNATATNNTITLGADFTGGHSGVSLWGGNTGWNGGDAVTGNTLNVNTGAGKSLTLGGVNNFEYLSFNHAGDVSVGALFRTSNLTKEGTGTLTLTAATNTHTGGAKVKAGTLELKDANAAGTDGVNVESGATLALDFSGDYDKPIAGTGTVHLAQNVTILKLKDGDIRNQITGAGSVTANPGAGKTLILNNANSYAGGTEVQTGTLELKDANAAGKGTVDVAGGATLRLSASGTYTNSALQGASGSTLEVTNTGVSVQKIDGFQNLYFILPTNTNANDTMLTVNGGAATRFAQMTNVGVGIAGGGSALQAGDTVTLLTNPVGLHNASGGELVQGTDYQLVTTGTQGFSLSHDFELSNDANSLHATVKTPPSPPPQPQPTPPQPKPQPQPEPEPVPPKPEPVPPKPQPVPPAPQVDPRTKAVPESRVAVMGMLNLGADQIVRMTGNLPSSTGGGAPNFGGSGVSPNTQTPDDATAFADISVHRQKIETGSHVNVNGAAAIVGAAKVVPLAGGGTAAVGAFFEYGDSSFKTHNGFDTGDVNGKGDSDYYGAGVLARVNLAGSENGAPFVEGSLHAGSIRNNWHTDDLRDAATGQRAQYDIRTPYMGAHVGAGYRWQTGAASHVEAYGQYLYTHMDGKDTNVALDPYHFNAVKSSRTRLGAKGTWAVSERSQAYAGAAWEREFDGTARATAYSFDVPAPTMKGNSAVLDAGLTFQPRQNLTTNVGVTGYAGKRKGAAANVEVQYLF